MVTKKRGSNYEEVCTESKIIKETKRDEIRAFQAISLSANTINVNSFLQKGIDTPR